MRSDDVVTWSSEGMQERSHSHFRAGTVGTRYSAGQEGAYKIDIMENNMTYLLKIRKVIISEDTMFLTLKQQVQGLNFVASKQIQ